MDNRKSQARNKQELILEVWERLDCESVGAVELERIQTAVSERFGPGAVDSPAAIARLLAEEGAVLRHPEVLDADTSWRGKSLTMLDETDFASLSGAMIAIEKLDALRREYLARSDKQSLSRIFEFVSEVQDELAVVAKNRTANERTRSEAKEVLEWLTLWRGSPDLFKDWLELRLASSQFREVFQNFVDSSATNEG